MFTLDVGMDGMREGAIIRALDIRFIVDCADVVVELVLRIGGIPHTTTNIRLDSCHFSSSIQSGSNSSFLHFNNSDFRNMVRGAWDSLHFFCSIVSEESCSTQVHVSPDNWLQRDTTEIHPPQRRGNTWCKNFYTSPPDFKEMEDDPQLVIAKLDGVEEEDDIIEFTNPDGRGYVWNFEPLRYGSFEFRQGPGVTAADETLAWVEFVVIESGPLSCNLKMFLQVGAFDGASKDSRSLAGRRIRRGFLGRLVRRQEGEDEEES